MLLEGLVAPRVAADGSDVPLRLTKDASQAVQDAHARYQEAVYRGAVFTGWVNQGTPGTVVAGNVSPVGAAAAALLALVNPPSSGRDLVLWEVVIASISGTVPTVPFMLNYGLAPAVSAAATNPSANNGVYNNLLSTSGNPVGRVVAQAALTGAPALSHGRPLAGVPAVGQAVREEMAGSVILPPGSVAAVAPGSAGTTYVAAVSLCWEEIAA